MAFITGIDMTIARHMYKMPRVMSDALIVEMSLPDRRVSGGRGTENDTGRKLSTKYYFDQTVTGLDAFSLARLEFWLRK
jgi:hypothetical protein